MEVLSYESSIQDEKGSTIRKVFSPHKLTIYEMKRIAIMLWVATMLAGCQNQEEPDVSSKVYLKNAEQFTFQSYEVGGQDYTVQVCLPLKFDKSKTYPVVYLLDGDIYLEMVKSISELLSFRMGTFKSHIQDVIIVGILYNQSDSVNFALRSRDLTPTLDTISPFGKSWPLAGGANKFLDFIEYELHPTILERYPVDETATGIAGSSFGGLLAAYAFLTRDQLFDRFIVISPCAVWDNELLIRLEEERFDKNKDFTRRLYLSAASFDSPYLVTDPTMRLFEAIKSRPYSDLALYYDYCENETHFSTFPRAITTGLRFCYPTN
jgi:predicted alpha/beta superfamily hydrolase